MKDNNILWKDILTKIVFLISILPDKCQEVNIISEKTTRSSPADRACETFHYLIGLCVRRQGPVSCFRAAGESRQVRLIETECRALMCAEE